jgi:deazaflavin-dependent oxidoreductase (nitroreductase family)
MSIEKSSARDAVRKFNKHVLNPAMLHLAGSTHFYASTIAHPGRRTGKHYLTPVVAVPVADGFVVPLPYGSHTDWLRNLQKASTGTLRCHGATYAVTSPTVIDAVTANAKLPPSRRRVFQRFGIREFLHLNLLAAVGDPGAGDHEIT